MALAAPPGRFLLQLASDKSRGMFVFARGEGVGSFFSLGSFLVGLRRVPAASWQTVCQPVPRSTVSGHGSRWKCDQPLPSI